MKHTFTLSPEVSQAYPNAQIRFVTVTGLRNGEVWDAVETRIADLEAQVASGTWQPLEKSDAPIASWHDAYRSFGTNPNRNRPSVDALSRRLTKNAKLPRINSAVNAYNLISVLYGAPSGAFDLDKISGPVTIRFGQGGDHFTPLGEPETNEEPTTTEVVYAQGSTVLTRHWNYRDSDLTKVTEDSRSVVFLMERISAEAVSNERMQQAQNDLAELLRPHCETLIMSVIEPETPSTELQDNEPGFMV
ncbi:B3/B4 domain-containing protein [Actinokineospora spheciospongiae]|uniref:B3/B4 domain-containing protein n=1 Tax=Actinokineospora spheciospongiae TaxID=909613 RepID=UPI000D709875|nr:phenylalanine--tRNA ligase beta subunit-related protein [Actinokineospora spheciospongiae]